MAKVIQFKRFFGIHRTLLLAFKLVFSSLCIGQSPSVSFVSEWNLKLMGPGFFKEKSFSSGENLFWHVQKEVRRQSNLGFPFVRITFDTLIYPNGESICIIANLDPGPVVIQSDLVQEGDTSISKKLIARALRVKSDQPFQNQRFLDIPTLIKQLTFAEVAAPPRLEFFGNQAIVHVNLARRKANYFTGILGILPQSENQGGTILTGNLDAVFVNLLNKGIGFHIKWNRFAPESQMADIKFALPYLSYNGLGFESSFDLFRQDSTINRRRFDLRINTSPNASLQFQFGYKSTTSSGFVNLGSFQKINLATHSISFSMQKLFPVVSGIELKKKQFSFSFFPTIKKISGPKSEVRSLPQLEASLNWKYPLLNLHSRFSIQTSGQIHAILSDQITLQDQARIGGNRSIRGFNENYFYTSQHALFSIQPQFLLDKTFLVGIFSDFFIFNSRLDNKGMVNPGWALGLGLATEIDLGNNQVQISLANGFAQDISLDFQTTKIHFGYLARF